MALTSLANFSNLYRVGPSPDEEEAGEVCIANISPVERQKRLRFGLGQFLFTVVLLGGIIVLDLDPLWRLPLLLLFWASASGYFQAREKT